MIVLLPEMSIMISIDAPLDNPRYSSWDHFHHSSLVNINDHGDHHPSNSNNDYDQ